MRRFKYSNRALHIIIATILASSMTNLASAEAPCKVFEDDLAGTYIGQCVDGLAQGKGIAKGKDSYEGEFAAGRPHGAGTYQWNRGSSYSGHWANGQPDGEGEMHFANGNVYRGQWKQGRQSGRGTMVWLDGHEYTGQWQDSWQQGSGKLKLTDGSTLEGNFNAGKPDGMMEKTAADGTRSVEPWRAGKLMIESQFVRNERLSKHCRNVGYPDASLKAGETGITVLRFRIDRQGSPQNSSVEDSSGFANLDRAALAALSQCKFNPPERGTSEWARVEFAWLINGTGSVQFAYPFSNGQVSTPTGNLRYSLAASYEQLDPAMKTKFRQLYEALPDDTEPPYPVGGLQALRVPIALMQARKYEGGRLSMEVHIAASGKARRVEVFATPSDDIARAVADIVMQTPFKPALCRNIPCDMGFPLEIKFVQH